MDDIIHIDATSTIRQLDSGVYLITTSLGKDYYVVTDDASISVEARAYGRPVKGHDGLLAYPWAAGLGDRIVEYEIARHRVRSGQDDADIHKLAMVGALEYPEYFGPLPAPTSTPWGQTCRYRQLKAGIYWVETDAGVEAIAIAYPIWTGELSEETVALGSFSSNDGYIFYQHDQCRDAIGELAVGRPQWLDDETIVALLGGC